MVDVLDLQSIHGNETKNVSYRFERIKLKFNEDREEKPWFYYRLSSSTLWKVWPPYLNNYQWKMLCTFNPFMKIKKKNHDFPTMIQNMFPIILRGLDLNFMKIEKETMFFLPFR